jgi:predicted N-acetyltransferase YhbS
MEGPRGVRKEEFESLRVMANSVFRPNTDEDMPSQYPQLFNEDNFENLRVCVDDGKCVSHVGMTERHASLWGCGIQVCCIGGVCTLPDYRKQGLASACFDDAVNKAYRDGVDIMIVSGDRHLYRERGCLRVGRDTAFALTAEMLPRVAAAAQHTVTVDTMTEDDKPRLMDCYRHEPVRFLRPTEDYGYAWQSRFVMNRDTDFLILREDGEFRGYVMLPHPREDKAASLSEFAGARHAIFAALPELFRRYNLTTLHWQVQRHDALFRSLCERAGLQGGSRTTPGTVKLINFPQLMERLRPYWIEKLGKSEAASLAFQQEAERYILRFRNGEFVTDRDTMTRLLFGTVEGSEAQAIVGQSAAARLLEAMLPLPTLWYGINYV